MIQVLCRVQRRTGRNESVEAFKQRCCNALHSCRAPKWAFAVGRFAEVSPGELANNFDWGLQHPSAPSDLCIIAAYSAEDARKPVLTVPPQEVLYAPSYVGH